MAQPALSHTRIMCTLQSKQQGLINIEIDALTWRNMRGDASDFTDRYSFDWTGCLITQSIQGVIRTRRY